MLVLGVFVAAVLLDFAAAKYYKAVAADRLHNAGLWSITMCLLSTVGLLSVVDVSKWYILPECLGLYVGTLLSKYRI